MRLTLSFTSSPEVSPSPSVWPHQREVLPAPASKNTFRLGAAVPFFRALRRLTHRREPRRVSLGRTRAGRPSPCTGDLGWCSKLTALCSEVDPCYIYAPMDAC